MDAISIGLGIALVVMVWLCLRGWVGDNYQLGEEERQPAEEATGPTTDERLDLILEAVDHLRIDTYKIQQKLHEVDNNVSQNADDLEPLRRKLHEVAKQVDHVAGHFAYVPIADIIEE